MEMHHYVQSCNPNRALLLEWLLFLQTLEMEWVKKHSELTIRLKSESRLQISYSLLWRKRADVCSIQISVSSNNAIERTKLRTKLTIA